MGKFTTRAPSSLSGLLMLVIMFSAIFYATLASHGREWWKKRTQLDSDHKTLEDFQQQFVQCVRDKGMGLDVRPVNECQVKLDFTDASAAIWRDIKTGELEGLVYTFDLCSMITVWEQVRNSTTILTKEYIDGLPNGWRDYAWKRINKGHSKMCSNITVCKEKLALVLPHSPPFVPRQYVRCAVVGNSGDVLQDLFGAEIDEHDAVIRMNGAPVQNYTHYVGEKTTFRILNRGSAKALDKVASMATSTKEVLIVKTTVHDIMNRMIQSSKRSPLGSQGSAIKEYLASFRVDREVPIRNPVYLMVGIPLGLSAKGTGVKAIQFALSVCQQVDIYGFTVDPGYLEWTRYFSESRIGHAPLQGRAYYQTMECLGLIRIHSPQRRVSTSLQPVVVSSNVRDAAAHLAMPIH